MHDNSQKNSRGIMTDDEQRALERQLVVARGLEQPERREPPFGYVGTQELVQLTAHDLARLLMEMPDTPVSIMFDGITGYIEHGPSVLFNGKVRLFAYKEE